MAKAPKAAKRRGRKAPPEPRGLTAGQLVATEPPARLAPLIAAVESDGGSVIGAYRDPLGGEWQVLAGLPIDRVQPTPYQRDVSETHVKRLSKAVDDLGRFLDPIIAVRTGEGQYWTPNGGHRLAAMKSLGARSIVALVVPEPEVAHRILILNTEKAHNIRERALEVIRLAQGLAELDDRPEREYELEFEEPALLTLGLCYQSNGRFSGGAYHPILRRVEAFLSSKLSQALEVRRERADRLLELDARVSDVVKGLKARGLESPYLKAFVIARINPLRFKRGAKAEFDQVLDQMTAAINRFDPGKIRPDQVARSGGAPAEE